MKTALNDVMCAGWRYPYVAKVMIPLKQCAPCVLKLASNIQNKSKVRFRMYPRDCLINKKYIGLFSVFLDHPSYIRLFYKLVIEIKNKRLNDSELGSNISYNITISLRKLI